MSMPESFVPSNGLNLNGGDSPSLGDWIIIWVQFGVGLVLFITYYSVFAIIDKEGSLNKHHDPLEEDEEFEDEEREIINNNSRNYVGIFGVILLLLIYGYYLFCPNFNFSIFMIQIVVSLSLFYIFGICIHSSSRLRHHVNDTMHHHDDDMVMMNDNNEEDQHQIVEQVEEGENQEDTNNHINVSPVSASSSVSFIKNWLTNEVKLPQYLDHFIKAGYNDIMSVITLTHFDLMEMGVNKKVHRKKIMIVVDKFLVDSYSKMIQHKGNNNEYDGDFEQIDEPFEF